MMEPTSNEKKAPAGPWVDIALLVVRIVFGGSLAIIGFEKLNSVEDFTGVVSSLGFPLPTLFAWLAVLSEAGGGICIAIGFMTRLSALATTAVMAVACYAHISVWGHPHATIWALDLAKFLTLSGGMGAGWFLVAFLAIASFGGGSYVVDQTLFDSLGGGKKDN
eukprot:TRINITY_DN240_c0_g1_i1.p1 TRINITY_DN240_c0_g1~~TRINITY_DN240_c0_g1_i1.p1  ORF type:complete len:164 (-),score=16.11 TRINITY_DN240_c0_g1_i1:547-1038(-)